MTKSDLKNCPFCGCAPVATCYPTLIIIECKECNCAKVCGDGSYSEWARQQEADEQGMIQIGAGAIATTNAYNKVATVWNTRV